MNMAVVKGIQPLSRAETLWDVFKTTFISKVHF